MPESQLPKEGDIVRRLDQKEIEQANRGFRSRLSKAFSRYPAVRQMISKDRWIDSPGTESVQHPNYPDWKHLVSRSREEIAVRSEFLGDHRLNSDNITFHLVPIEAQGISFKKVVQGNIVEDLTDTSEVLGEVEVTVSRIEAQLGRRVSG